MWHDAQCCGGRGVHKRALKKIMAEPWAGSLDVGWATAGVGGWGGGGDGVLK